ncbi:hypothetical protein ACFWUP_19810 [Nocardia sp. NPDC058658]|uniref:hypothetical protein n=1 Tax=Nocardia sp. NPDC058658 TaxID=3346580 RepID=UPI00364B9655
MRSWIGEAASIDAVIASTLRWSSMTPFGLAHARAIGKGHRPRPGQQSGRAEQLLAGVSETLHARVDQLDDVLTKLLLDRIPALPGDAPMVRLLRASVRSNLLAAIEIFRDHTALETMSIPEVAREYARGLAQRGASPTALIRAYRVGQQFALDRGDRPPGRDPRGHRRGDPVADHRPLRLYRHGQRTGDGRVSSRTRTLALPPPHGAHGGLGATAQPVRARRRYRRSGAGLLAAPTTSGLVLWTGSTVAEPARLTALEDIVTRMAEALRATGQP